MKEQMKAGAVLPKGWTLTCPYPEAMELKFAAPGGGYQTRYYTVRGEGIIYAFLKALHESTPQPPPEQAGSVGVQPNGVLPCDVMVAPRTIIRRGCKVSTLLTCIEQRFRAPEEARTFGELDAAIDVHRGRVEAAYANVCSPTPHNTGYTTLDCVATDGCKASVQAVAPAPKESP